MPQLERMFQEAVPYDRDDARSKRLAKEKLDELLTLGGTDLRYPYQYVAGHTLYSTHHVDGKKYMQIAAVITSPAFNPINFADYVEKRPCSNKRAVIAEFLESYFERYPEWKYLTTAQ